VKRFKTDFGASRRSSALRQQTHTQHIAHAGFRPAKIGCTAAHLSALQRIKFPHLITGGGQGATRAPCASRRLVALSSHRRLHAVAVPARYGSQEAGAGRLHTPSAHSHQSGRPTLQSGHASAGAGGELPLGQSRSLCGWESQHSASAHATPRCLTSAWLGLCAR